MMLCEQARRRMLGDAAGSGTDAELAEHLAECPACRELAADDARLARELSTAADAELALLSFDDLQSQLTRERGPRAWLRSRSTTTRLTLGLAAITLTAGSSLLTLRPDLGVYPILRFAAELALLALVAAAATWHFLRPLHLPPRRPGMLGAWLAAGLLAPMMMALLPIAHAAHPASLAGAGSTLLSAALKCFIYGTVLASVVFGVVLVMGRDLGHRAAVVLASCCGAISGVAALHLHCPITHRAHLLLGHASIAIFLGGLTWLAHRVLWRATSR